MLAFSMFFDTSGVTNGINKGLITLKGNSSSSNRILITAYRCLLVTLNKHAFLLFATLSVLCADKTVSVLAESLPFFLICLIVFFMHLFSTPSKPCFIRWIGPTLNADSLQGFTLKQFSNKNIGKQHGKENIPPVN